MSTVKAEHNGVWAGVDILRGLLAIFVLCGHALGSSKQWHFGSDHSEWPSLVGKYFSHGGYWVVGFFIISGFCIHRSVLGMTSNHQDFTAKYVAARITRLYPMYGITLLLAACSWMVLGSFEQDASDGWVVKLIGHLLLLQGFTGVFHELSPSWSISYEAVYYLAWPLCLTICGWRRKQALVIGVLGSLMFSAVAVIMWKMTGGQSGSGWILCWLVPSQFILWLGGATLAEYWDEVLLRVRIWWFPLALTGVLCGAAIVYYLNYIQARQWMIIIACYCALPFWLMLIASFSLWKGFRKWTGIASVLGLLSYPLYIAHQLLFDVLIRVLVAPGFWWGTIILVTLAMIIVLLIGVPLERATLEWRKKFLAGFKSNRNTQVL